VWPGWDGGVAARCWMFENWTETFGSSVSMWRLNMEVVALFVLLSDRPEHSQGTELVPGPVGGITNRVGP